MWYVPPAKKLSPIIHIKNIIFPFLDYYLIRAMHNLLPHDQFGSFIVLTFIIIRKWAISYCMRLYLGLPVGASKYII